MVGGRLWVGVVGGWSYKTSKTEVGVTVLVREVGHRLGRKDERDLDERWGCVGLCVCRGGGGEVWGGGGGEAD